MNKIAVKLSTLFIISLLIFAIIVGILFVSLFNRHSTDVYKSELLAKAQNISSIMSEYISGGAMGGYGMFLRTVGTISMVDVWIFDEKHEIITPHKEPRNNVLELPPDATEVVDRVFNGETSISEEFSTVFETPTTTIGVPVKNDSGKIVAAVLVHSTAKSIEESIFSGIILLLISVLAALLIAVVISVKFSFSFTKPLKSIKETALKLSHGEYNIKTKVESKDEIGELATAMDVLSEKLYIADEQSKNLEKMRKDFVSNVSHELKTPVTVIHGSLSAILEGVVTDPVVVKEYQEQMLNETIVLERLILDLFELSKLENPDLPIVFEEVSIIDILSDLKKSSEKLAVSKKVQINFEIKDNFTIFADYGRMRQMIMILIDNAIKFSNIDGTVKVLLEKKKLTVADSGKGIPKEELPYIFDKFYKSRKEDNKEGSGLGLAIAKQIAIRHGFTIEAKNNKYSGAVFEIGF